MIPVGDPGGRDPSQGTEDASRRFHGLDTWPTGEILQALWHGQSHAIAACLSVLPALSSAIESAVARLSRSNGSAGRLVYAGAGSAGMIAALDALELGGTFSWPEDRTLIFVAGGLQIQRGPDPAAEDDVTGARAAARDAKLGQADVVVGVSASGSSPYTVAILEEARARGALAIAVAGRSDSPLVRAADHSIVVATGAEVIAGSTRLAAGTAQKVVMNLFSTVVMVRLGAVYDNLMIDLRPANAKLRQRQASIVASIAEVDTTIAAQAVARHGDVKHAVLGLAGVPVAEIDQALVNAGGNLRVALDRARRSRP